MKPTPNKIAKPCQAPLKNNPFQTYRDRTGQWIVIQYTPEETQSFLQSINRAHYS